MSSRKKRPPDAQTLAIWRERGRARATDGCLLDGLHGTCRHGKPSWLDHLDAPQKESA